MSTSTSGLTRRRGGAGAAGDNGLGGGLSGVGVGSNSDDERTSSRVSSPGPRGGGGGGSNALSPPSTERASYNRSSAGENGHTIAYDPRDISERAERNKQPKLTLMEEVLLLGLKDKQVLFSLPTHYSPLFSPCFLSPSVRL